jgi:hypothetical protein
MKGSAGCSARRASPSAHQDLESEQRPGLRGKKNRILELYAIADGTAEPGQADPTVVICVDEFGPLNLQPYPGRQWAPRGGGGSSPRRRRRATFNRPHGVRHVLAAYDLSTDRLYGGSPR